MVKGLLVGMFMGVVVTAAMLVGASLMVPLPRGTAQLAEEPRRDAPQASAPQGSAAQDAPRQTARADSSASAPQQPAQSATQAGQGSATAPTAQPAANVQTQVPTPSPAAPQSQSAVQDSQRVAPPAAPAAQQPMPQAPASAAGVAESAPARAVEGEPVPADDITMGDAVATQDPEPGVVEEALVAADTALPRAITAVVARERAPNRPLRPREERRPDELNVDSGPRPPIDMLVQGPRPEPAVQQPAQASNASSAPAEPTEPTPLAGSEFIARLAGTPRSAPAPAPEPEPVAPAVAPAPAPAQPAGSDQVAIATPTAPAVPSQERDAPSVGQPVVPLTERTGVRPLTERAPTPPLTERESTAAPAPTVTPAWRQNLAETSVGDEAIMAVVLIDDGLSARERQVFIRRGLPVTVAVDATRPNADGAVADYRAAGMEVLLITGTMEPEEALAAFPGVLGMLTPSLSPRRVEALQAAGHAAVLRPGGLDGGLRAFQQLGLPGLRAYRDIDAGRERDAIIIRYLARASFEASRTGGEIILGRMYPDTLSALTQFMTTPDGQRTPLGPVSVLMDRQIERLFGGDG